MMTPFRRRSLMSSSLSAPYWPTSQPRRSRWGRPSLTPPVSSSRSRLSCVPSVNSVPPVQALPGSSAWSSTSRAVRSGGLFGTGTEWRDGHGIDRDILRHRGDRDQQAAVLALGAIMVAVSLNAGIDEAVGCDAEHVRALGGVADV